jgi:DNA polymerase-3 subunit delta'
MTESVWSDLLGQPEAIEQLRAAVANRDQQLQHAWLFSGPAGSGRSNLARAFAAALLCKEQGCGHCHQCRLVAAGIHPDVAAVSTDRVVITIDEVRELVERSQLATSVGNYRIVIMEDADRMTERTSNVLLRALEEPPPNTLWLLCAPSSADMLPTIRSRVRNVVLRLPSIDEVTDLLLREGVDPKLARICAAEAQCHVGMARRLATSQEARARRSETLQIALGVNNLSQAMVAAERLLGIAKRDAEASSRERDEQELEALRAALGLGQTERVPAELKSQFKDLEANQKRRSTRALRDGIDRILTDLESAFRDIASIQLASGATLVNQSIEAELRQRAAQTSLAQTIQVTDEISLARKRLDGNVRDLILLESLATYLIVS